MKNSFFVAFFFFVLDSYAQTSSFAVSNSIKILAVGDIMLGSLYPSTTNMPPKDGEELLVDFKTISNKSDFVFGNLEGTLLDSGETTKRCSDKSKCFAFRMPTKFGKLLSEANFDFLSIANNHIGDFGILGKSSTQKVLQDNCIEYSGLEDCPYRILEIKGKRIGVLSSSAFVGTVDMLNDTLMLSYVNYLDNLCDIVIVSFHGGGEGMAFKNIKNTNEIFYEEDRGNLCEFGYKVIDAGADLVLGHGPHIPRAMELYKNKLIVYSMGNFCTYGQFNLKNYNGIAPIFNLELDKNGIFIRGSIISMKQLNKGGPVFDTDNQAYSVLKDLTLQDFKDSKIKFSSLDNTFYNSNIIH